MEDCQDVKNVFVIHLEKDHHQRRRNMILEEVNEFFHQSNCDLNIRKKNLLI